VQQLVKEGVMPAPIKQKYDLVACVNGYIKYLQDKAAGQKTGDNNLDIHKERIRLVRAQADKMEIERDVLNGTLIPVEEAEHAFAGQILKCRSQLMSLPVRIAPLILAMSEYGTIEALIRDNIKEALNELSGSAWPDDINADETGNAETRPAARSKRKRVGKQVSVPQ